MDLQTVHSSWCEIFPSRIAKNLRLARQLLPANTEFCAVLKADSYGHGIDKVVPIICEQNIQIVGITSNAEAQAVRNAGYTNTLIRLRSATPSEIKAALPEKVQEQVSTLHAAQTIFNLVSAGSRIEGLHLSLNSGGISRDGLDLLSHENRQTAMEIIDLIGNHIVGICSHFPSNEIQELQASNEHFQADLNWIFANSKLNRSDVKVHAGSSLTLVSGQEIATDFYRCGAIMYGILKPEVGFESTMQLKARITSLSHFPKGSTIGYDRAIKLNAAKVLANISVGYSNGFRRNYFGRSFALIRGQRVPILGKISMNSIVADVTQLSTVEVEDEVVIFGQQGSEHIDLKNIERQSDTIMAEIYTDWGQRNPRIYL